MPPPEPRANYSGHVPVRSRVHRRPHKKVARRRAKRALYIREENVDNTATIDGCLEVGVRLRQVKLDSSVSSGSKLFSPHMKYQYQAETC